ncbi:hypothetical protein [Candidatus Poriferisocius sp.]|uniref:hypothetical protein n=1 Tax=Candidatus Poriferisocius sp. TaxID=3101276 RepID=UPI003B024F8B
MARPVNVVVTVPSRVLPSVKPPGTARAAYQYLTLDLRSQFSTTLLMVAAPQLSPVAAVTQVAVPTWPHPAAAPDWTETLYDVPGD